MTNSNLRRSLRDPGKFTDFFRDHYDSVVAYVARGVLDPEAALDLTAEAFGRRVDNVALALLVSAKVAKPFTGADFVPLGGSA